jgi:hydroxymethylglutaryl-CoA lyase
MCKIINVFYIIMNSTFYPKCIRSFLALCESKKELTNIYVNKLVKVKPFDVTLRDGLQGLNSDEQKDYTTNFKQQIYKEIIEKYNPINIEIGSCVNTKILPIFKDTEELFNCIKDNKNKYILVPNQEQLMNAIKFGATNFSFITSVSNSFQFKNTKMTTQSNLNNLNNMINFLDDYKINIDNSDIIQKNKKFNIKLYVSCINECPIEGKIPIDNIISYLYYLTCKKIDKICLSDTCGNLTHADFNKLICTLYEMGVDIHKFTLHLHVKQDREEEVEKIVHTAIDYGIEEFDVSDLKTGGCSITMDKHNLAPNMSYENYYKFLTNYLLS